MEAQRAATIAETLTSGKWTHDYPITADEAEEMGLPISTDIPGEVLELMELYPQGGGRRPSVQYIPVPYRREERPAGGRQAGE
jgi:ClpP class serine protease